MLTFKISATLLVLMFIYSLVAGVIASVMSPLTIARERVLASIGFAFLIGAVAAIVAAISGIWVLI